MRDAASASEKVYVQFGCGLCAPKGWMNYDASPRLRVERLPGLSAVARLAGRRLFPSNIEFGDIVAGLPLPNDSADAVYASHVLEHLARSDMVQALQNTFRLLKPGGIFRLIVPDLEWRARRYLSDLTDAHGNAADCFIQACNFGESVRPRGLLGLLRAKFGNSAHRWMYDEDLMKSLMREAGFEKVRRCTYGDSGEPMFAKVEDWDRFYDSGEAELAIEGRKPYGTSGT